MNTRERKRYLEIEVKQGKKMLQKKDQLSKQNSDGYLNTT